MLALTAKSLKVACIVAATTTATVQTIKHVPAVRRYVVPHRSEPAATPMAVTAPCVPVEAHGIETGFLPSYAPLASRLGAFPASGLFVAEPVSFLGGGGGIVSSPASSPPVSTLPPSSVPPLNAVPDISTWIGFLVGFGMLGVKLRRKISIKKDFANE